MAKRKDEIVIPMDKEEGTWGGGKGRFRVPEGNYPVKILSAKYVTSSQKQTPGLEVKYVITAGKHKGKRFEDTCWLSPKALPRLRQLLEVIGIKVPKKAFKIKVSTLKGKTLWVDFVDDEDEYEKNGKTIQTIRSEVSQFLTEEEAGGMDEDEEDDEDADDELDDDEEDDDEDKDDDDGLDDMDRAELKAHIKKNKLDVKVKKSMDEDEIRAAIREADDEDDDELEELDVDEDL